MNNQEHGHERPSLDKIKNKQTFTCKLEDCKIQFSKK